MRLVTRAEWRARPPRSRVAAVPGFGSTVHYEGPRMGTFDHSTCPSKVRGIQSFHMDTRKWSDLAYTALICPHGFTFEGRWVGIRNGANGTNPGNRDAYAVCCLIGVGDPLPDVMLDELVAVLAFLDVDGNAGPGVNGHRDWKPTACPGEPLYLELPELRREKLAAIGTPAAHPTPIPTTDLEELLLPIAKNDDDARRTYVRQTSRRLLGRTPGPTEYGSWLTILERDGAEALEIALGDSAEGVEWRKKDRALRGYPAAQQ